MVLLKLSENNVISCLFPGIWKANCGIQIDHTVARGENASCRSLFCVFFFERFWTSGIEAVLFAAPFVDSTLMALVIYE